MKDLEIIKAAFDSGLCFPVCWGLVSSDKKIYYDLEDDSMESVQMEKLRTFAHLIIERTKSNV